MGHPPQAFIALDGWLPRAASSHSAEFPSLCSEVGPDRSLILSACAAACQSNRRDWLSCCLCGFAAREWAADLDFSALRKLPAEYLSEERLVRRGDTVWQVCLHDRRLVLVMVEFQSGEEPRMVLRILAYTSLLYQELVSNNAPGLRRPWPAAGGSYSPPPDRAAFCARRPDLGSHRTGPRGGQTGSEHAELPATPP